MRKTTKTATICWKQQKWRCWKSFQKNYKNSCKIN